MSRRCAPKLFDTFVHPFTLLETMRWLAAVALAVGASKALLQARNSFRCVMSPILMAKISAQDLQSIADGWRVDHPNECPTAQRLKDDHEMSAGSSIRDAWGMPWRIACCHEDTTAISMGPDMQAATKDDIRFPDDHWCR